MNIRLNGITHMYLDEKIKDYSNLGIGLIIRGIGHSFKIAYIDVTGKSNKFSNFLENLSLNYSFIKNFDRINLEIYSFKSYDKISKSIIPLVEFNSLNRKIFFESINFKNKYDLIIFDNLDLNIISKEEIKEIIKNKNQFTEIVFTFSNKNYFNSVKNYADIVSIYNYKSKSNLITNKKIIYIYGEGRGKSIYSFGYIIRNFINKKDIKLIYFDKGDNINGELQFFNAIKKWSKLNNLYGKFDFVVNGAKRFSGTEIRKTSTKEDKKEAEEALMLLKTSLKLKTPIIADELGKVLRNNIIEREKIFEVLNSVENELFITGDLVDKELEKISNTVIKIENEKNIENLGLKQGIDF